jgi:hypothetical protein
MLMKLGNKEEGNLADLNVWQTGYSWVDEGCIHPITAKVFYTRPQFEVVDVALDFDRKLDIPSRLQSMILASVVEEYSHAAAKLKQEYADKTRRTLSTDPYFEE